MREKIKLDGFQIAELVLDCAASGFCFGIFMMLLNSALFVSFTGAFLLLLMSLISLAFALCILKITIETYEGMREREIEKHGEKTMDRKRELRR